MRLNGFMTMPPPDVDRRPCLKVRCTHPLADRVARADFSAALPVLSMGMSGDFEAAIACGATHVRIGTAIFGARAGLAGA